MIYLKNKYFNRWAQEQKITDAALSAAIGEFESGLFEAALGNYLFKKRIALAGKGKSGGARTILFYQRGKKLIFCLGFNKNRQDNLSSGEIKLLHKLSDIYQDITDDGISKNIKHKEFLLVTRTE
jgi:hypothetical protein